MTEANIEVIDDTIVISMSGYRVGFRTRSGSSQLIRCEFATDETQAEVSLYEFLALAWQAANDKAREIGWIV